MIRLSGRGETHFIQSAPGSVGESAGFDLNPAGERKRLGIEHRVGGDGSAAIEPWVLAIGGEVNFSAFWDGQREFETFGNGPCSGIEGGGCHAGIEPSSLELAEQDCRASGKIIIEKAVFLGQVCVVMS